MIFRGYLQSTLQRGAVTAVVVSGLSFGVLHLASNGGQQGWVERVAYLAMPIGFGLAAGALRLLTRSCWAAVGVHAGVHVAFLAGLFLGLGNGGWLWLLTGAVWTLIAVVALTAWSRQGCAAVSPGGSGTA